MQNLVVILGTNASGKSELGIRLANHLSGEVVSADSRQVYRGLDLGSGKITPAQAGTVKHHLIDVADLSEYFTLAQYQRAAYSAIDSISRAGKRPLLVGGTGLYISAIVEGYELVDVPPNAALRAELEDLPLPQLVERLEKSAPDAASRIDKSNRRRLIRAIEIAAAGRPHTAARQSSPRYHCLQLGLTWPLEVLEARIESRLRQRLANGMIDEVAGLRTRGVSDTRLDKLGLEYRYIARYLRGELATLDDLRRELGIAIRQFAKGQLTWFKRDHRIIWLDPFRDYFQEACDRIQEWEEKQSASTMIKSYKHIIWDWNGTIFCDVDLGIEIINGLLHQRNLPLVTKLSYRDLFTIPVKDYYDRLGFDFVKEPFEIVGKLWMDEYERRKFECGLYEGIVEVLDGIQQLGIGQSILSAYSQHTLDQMVDHYSLRKYFTHVAGLDNIYAASKLHLGRELIKRLGVGKQEAVVVGDTEHDYEVARAMDADCILIANGHQSKARLQALGVPVLDDIRSLVH